MKRAVVFGDSYVAAADRGRPGWARLAPLLLGWRGTHLGSGGTGFVATSGARLAYGTRLGQVIGLLPDVLIVQATGNDALSDLDAVRTATGAFLQQVREALPETSLYVVGPMWAKDGAEHLPALDALTSEAARAHRAVYLPALDWLTPDLIGPDGAHPTWRGHWRIARRVAAGIRRAS